MPAPVALLAKWPWRRGTPVIIQRPERKMAWFVEQGWKVIGKDSDVYPSADAPAQSNPRRIIQPGEDA